MSLNESIVEDAELEWFLLRHSYGGQVGEVGYAVGHGPAFAGLRRAKPSLAPGEYAGGTLTPPPSQGEREFYREVVQTRCTRTLIPAFSQREKEEEREAIRRLNPPIPEEARATLRKFRIVRIERRLNP